MSFLKSMLHWKFARPASLMQTNWSPTQTDTLAVPLLMQTFRYGNYRWALRVSQEALPAGRFSRGANANHYGTGRLLATDLYSAEAKARRRAAFLRQRRARRRQTNGGNHHGQLDPEILIA